MIGNHQFLKHNIHPTAWLPATTFSFEARRNLYMSDNLDNNAVEEVSEQPTFYYHGIQCVDVNWAERYEVNEE